MTRRKACVIETTKLCSDVTETTITAGSSVSSLRQQAIRQKTTSLGAFLWLKMYSKRLNPADP
jgi:hypothetical protein